MSITTSLIIIGIALFVLFTAAAYSVYAERKVSAWIQQRVGPNRVGPFGLLQPLADVIKLLLKEDIVPSQGNKTIHFLAPIISTTMALTAMAVIPFSKGIYIADINVGILFVFAVQSIAVYGITLAGWASNSKYALMGGLRSSAQMISYELSMGLSLVSVIVITVVFSPNQEYLKLTSVVEAQHGFWNIFRNPLGFLIFATCAFAETNRLPFDLVEAEQELVGGFHTEYSSMKFALFFVAEYINVIVSSAIMSTLFLGGYLGIGEEALGVENWSEMAQIIWGLAWFLGKTFSLVFVFLWVRWTLPRFKYNQLMDIGWKKFLPLALINLVVITSIMMVYKSYM